MKLQCRRHTPEIAQDKQLTSQGLICRMGSSKLEVEMEQKKPVILSVAPNPNEQLVGIYFLQFSYLIVIITYLAKVVLAITFI